MEALKYADIIEYLEQNSVWLEELNTDWTEKRVKTIEKIRSLTN